MAEKILLLYKKTVYTKYKSSKVFKSANQGGRLKGQLSRLQSAHEEHSHTLSYVKDRLKTNGIGFDEYYRGGKIPFDRYKIIVTVGGDGTFLKAAAGSKQQLIVGVNSAPSTSVGRLCVARRENFDAVLNAIVSKKRKVSLWQRLALIVEGGTYHVMNDVLFAHENPSVISRYLIKVGRVSEEQRSSGVWISTPIGSTGAIGSAGAKSIDSSSKDVQYLPRELYATFSKKYRLTGGLIKPGQKLTIDSLMPSGRLFMDGGNQTISLSYGQRCQITLSKYPIRTLQL